MEGEPRTSQQSLKSNGMSVENSSDTTALKSGEFLPFQREEEGGRKGGSLVDVGGKRRRVRQVAGDSEEVEKRVYTGRRRRR